MFFNSFRKLLYTGYQKMFGYSDLERLKELRKTQWFSKDEIEKFQWERLKKLLEYAKRNVPYYKKALKNINIQRITKEDFQDIPFLTKEIINKNREVLISKRYKRSELILNSTSGSTGKKLIFYNDEKCLKSNGYYRAAVNLRNLEWLGTSIWDKKVKLWGLHQDISETKKIKEKIMNWIFQTLFLSSYDMTPEMMDLYRKRINRYMPKIIIGQASSLYVFAKYLEKKDKKTFSPKGIISSAETLYPYQRSKIESVFGCKIFNRYGCREFGTIAHECEEHIGLHINAEHVYIEIVDEDGNSCKPGEMGEIVVTDLDNYGFPFIRYKIGDVGVISDKLCSCGRGLPLLEKVEGRIFDVVVGTNGNHLCGTFWTILLREDIDGVDNFQVIQESFGELVLKLVVNENFTEKEKKKLLKRINEDCGEDMKVDIQLVNEIPKTESGKHRFVISKVSPFCKSIGGE